MSRQIFDNYIVAEIKKREIHKKKDSELFYLRTSNGVEVDLLIDRKTEVEFIEIKTSETFRRENCVSDKVSAVITEEITSGVITYHSLNKRTIYKKHD